MTSTAVTGMAVTGMTSDVLTAQPSRCKTILIVDDSKEDRAIFRRYLTHENHQHYRVLEVDSAEEGLLSLAHNSVDLVLLDYGLPGIDGLEFLQKLQAQIDQQGLLERPPVLMLTGQGDERIAAQAIKAGAQDYIVKQNRMEGVLNLAVRTALREAALQARVKAYQAQQLLAQDIMLRIRQSLDAQAVLTQAALEVRRLLNCDRVILYRFLSDGAGVVEVESVKPPWMTIRGQVIRDSCFQNGRIDKYLAGKTTAIGDIHTEEITPCHRDLLAQFQVQSNLVVPIVMTTLDADSHGAGSTFAQPQAAALTQQNKTIWGLLIVHQCSLPRQWKETEVQLLRQLCDQLAIALQQSALYQQLQFANQQLESKVEARTAQLKQANEQLLSANQALKTSNRELEQFAYIASHDLREPLRKIKSFAELFAKRYQSQTDDTGDRYISYITDGATRMQRLINDLLAYSRIGRCDLTRRRTPLENSLGQAVETLSEQILHKQAILHVQSLPTLSVDPLQMEQLFRNLIENALKYSSDAPPNIQISATQLESTWKISVRDNGIGIASEFYERIFIIFQRLHSKSEYSGTGIGLAICQKIVERHGGQIGVESSSGKGTTFWFTLPAEESVGDIVSEKIRKETSVE